MSSNSSLRDRLLSLKVNTEGKTLRIIAAFQWKQLKPKHTVVRQIQTVKILIRVKSHSKG